MIILKNVGLNHNSITAEYKMTTRDLACVDHLIYGTPDLDATIQTLGERLGVKATIGGRHPGEGTRNALYSLGRGCYLEIMGPDPDQPDPDRPRWLGLDDLTAPKMVAWAAKASDLDSFRQTALRKGVELGQILSGGRTRPDGSQLNWRLTDPRQWIADGAVPFFIDWGSGPHPSESAGEGLRLNGFRIVHPDSKYVESVLERLELNIPVTSGPRLSLIAILETPAGIVELK